MNEKNSVPIKELTESALFLKVGEICAVVNSVIDNKELLEVSLSQTLELFGANRGSIFILDSEGENLVMKSSKGMKQGEKEKMIKRLGEGIVGRVGQLKRPVFVDDISKDQQFGDFKARGSYQTPSFICAPLLIKDKLIGVINISDKSSGSKFDKNEMQLLDFISSQIALNYRRIELYQKFKSTIKEKQNLENKLGESDQETEDLKKQIFIQEKFATIGKLAGGIAHEFNNPLDGVMRYTNLCLELEKEDEVVRGYLFEIKQGLNRMANIVKNLLACSRNEFPSRDKVRMNEALEHALSLVSMEIGRKNVKIVKNLASNLPEFPDYGIETILTNIVRNACDDMEEGGTITIDAECTNDIMTIKMSDTGSGMPEDVVKQIFEPFYTTKDIDKGCGLGLTIVGEIVKKYEGKINVESQEDKGTTFIIKLPIGN